MKHTVVAKKSDSLKWLLLLFLLAGTVAADTYYSQVAWSIRAALFLVLLPILGWVFYLTRQGKQACLFVKQSVFELKRVIWPKRQEAFRMTFLVILVVMLVSLLLWGLDTFFLWAVKSFSSLKL